ncbi:MAG: hypothetical protein IT379_31435 [Deltaproteobacteria bacterium]|nr:hypothetical protein [Deltaproteobacteria bacterium]
MRGLGLLGVVGGVVIASCQGSVGFEGPGLGSGSGTGSPASGRRNPPRAAEECANGYDDNGDGRADEGCSCAPGQTQTCFTGDSTARRKGICVDGVQTCELVFEFPQWGDCLGEIVPISEIGGNGADDDCDGDTDEGADFPGAGGEGICTPAELELCDNGADDDCDGLTDCADPQCGATCPGGGGDYPGASGEPPHCAEGAVCIAGQSRWCDTPTYCSFGTQVCMPDGRWGECVEVTDRPGEGICDDDYYYDLDCCLEAGACCQNFPYDDSSVGSCEGIACE